MIRPYSHQLHHLERSSCWDVVKRTLFVVAYPSWCSVLWLLRSLAKLGIGLLPYLRDRLVSPDAKPSLAERIDERPVITAQLTG